MTLGVLGEYFSGEIEMRMLANAGENIQHLASVRLGILHPIGREDRQAKFRSEINQRPINPIFAPQKMPLNFDIHVFATKGIDQTLRAIFRVLGSAGCQPALSGSLPDSVVRLTKKC